MKVINWVKNLHLHKWKTTDSQYRNETEKELGIQSVPATRTCSVCGKKQELDIHCLGFNPPQYTHYWRNITND